MACVREAHTTPRTQHGPRHQAAARSRMGCRVKQCSPRTKVFRASGEVLSEEEILRISPKGNIRVR